MATSMKRANVDTDVVKSKPGVGCRLWVLPRSTDPRGIYFTLARFVVKLGSSKTDDAEGKDKWRKVTPTRDQHAHLIETMDAVASILANHSAEPLPAAFVAIGGLVVLKFALGVSCFAVRRPRSRFN